MLIYNDNNLHLYSTLQFIEFSNVVISAQLNRYCWLYFTHYRGYITSLQSQDSNSGVLIPSTMYCHPAQTPNTLPTMVVLCNVHHFTTSRPNPMASPFMQLKGRNIGMGDWGLGEEGVESPRLDSTYLFWVSANLDGIGNEASCFFFSHGADVFQTNCQLMFPQGQRMGNKHNRH